MVVEMYEMNPPPKEDKVGEGVKTGMPWDEEALKALLDFWFSGRMFFLR